MSDHIFSITYISFHSANSVKSLYGIMRVQRTKIKLKKNKNEKYFFRIK